ncbi:heme exporter protein CcmD [Ancylobacter mangrovi]|uniref:Heme exporter protein D n=1 Tax=Ancylobacter mangrovi TaxID=2972472 RepID=A0A9X2T7D0_9HYPH|nr:heme exporter protein CcmD [Ancylobacter mangrovi]MCS0497379.1 heme exporter protein CcmD [Ancylobacter mangrovi]MCS0504070.1 heme exporter protein CcmD [Ancylobacter mangrovi]
MLGEHAVFIIAAFAASVVVLGLLTLWTVLDGRAVRRRLAELEARGIRRRSAGGDAS